MAATLDTTPRCAACGDTGRILGTTERNGCTLQTVSPCPMRCAAERAWQERAAAALSRLDPPTRIGRVDEATLEEGGAK